MRIARRDLRNLLIHAQVLAGEVELWPTQWLDMPGPGCFVAAEGDGLLEPPTDLGAPVEVETPIAQVHRIDRSGDAPVVYRSRRAGLLIARHFPGLVAMGDCLGVIAVGEVR